MTTGLDTFDKTVQESNLWLKDVMERLNTHDRHHAYSTLRAVLHALRNRIGPENAAHLGAQLPMLLRGLFYEGWDPTGKPTKERHEAAFLAHIARELPRAAEPGEVEEGACAVLDVLSKHIDRGAAVKLAGILPQDLRRFWPAFIQTAARERQRRLKPLAALAVEGVGSRFSSLGAAARLLQRGKGDLAVVGSHLVERRLVRAGERILSLR